MSRKNDCWGIEVGANAIKAVRLHREGPQVTLADFDVLPFKKILTTPDLDVDEAIQVNLEQFVQRHDVGGTTVVVSVAGHMAFARFAKLPPVDPKKIPDIVKFEAVQQIPFPIEQVEWDYQVFQEAESPDVEVGIFAIMRDRVMDFLSNYRAVGLPVDGVTLSPLAVYNALAYDLDLKADSPGMIFMDIGTTSTDVIVAEEGHTWIRTLPLGGNNFTEALVSAFKLSFPKAEKLKREAATSKYARQIYVAMRPVFSDLVQEVQRSLGYYQSLNRDANLTQLVGVGSTFRLPGLRKFLKQQLQIEVIRPEGFKLLSIEGKRASDLANHAVNLTTAYGLALQGVGLERVGANILPRHILKQKLWRAKQPWIGAAAALLLVATVGAVGRQWADRGAHNMAQEAYERSAKDATTEAERLQRGWEEIEVTDSRQQIDNLHRIADFRLLWPLMLGDIHAAMASTDPQEELLSSDYEKIKTIKRGERRRVGIRSIHGKYEFTYGEQASRASGMSGAEDEDADRKSPWSDGASDEQEQEEEDDGMFTGMRRASVRTEPPSFLVSISGTTSHKQGRENLTRGLKTWLAQHVDRADRPYTIVPLKPDGTPGDDGVRWTRSVQTGAAAGADGGLAGLGQAVRSRMSRPPMSAGGMDLAMRLPTARTAGRLGAPRTAALSRRVASATGGGEAVPDLLPQYPLADEAALNDWDFEILWRFTLRKPADARAAEDKLLQAAAAGTAAVAVAREDRP